MVEPTVCIMYLQHKNGHGQWQCPVGINSREPNIDPNVDGHKKLENAKTSVLYRFIFVLFNNLHYY